MKKFQLVITESNVLDAGGLHILGTERHESRRIDNQLRGRAGRQGDPRLLKVFPFVEDDLLRLFISDSVEVYLRESEWVTIILNIKCYQGH